MSRRMSLLNQLSFGLYWIPHVLLCLALLLACPLFWLYGLINPAGAVTLQDRIADWMDKRTARIKASRDRLSRDEGGQP